MNAEEKASAATADLSAEADRLQTAEREAIAAWEASAVPFAPACGGNHPLNVYFSCLDTPELRSHRDHDYMGEARAFFARQSPETVALAERAVAAVHARREAEAEWSEAYGAAYAEARGSGPGGKKRTPIVDMRSSDNEGAES